MGRMQPDHDIGIDVARKQGKTATDGLTNTLTSSIGTREGMMEWISKDCMSNWISI
ncbi:hypothetical protein RvVAR031_pl04020 (plasmid) [Agrobacterium vitis]|nr:hypothetical protein RvVAR031_pl04020 [Agrobacterium vitis]